MTLQMLKEADDKQLMTITPEWMKEKFDEMNKLLFDGKLKPCRLSLFTSGEGSRGHTLGWFKHRPLSYSKNRHDEFGKHPSFVKDSWGDRIWLNKDNFNQYADPEIQLNGNYNWTEKAALSTLVHEMCHYYDYKDGWVPIQGHGPSFRSIAAWVSSKSNDFFTVERLAKAEQMDEMDFTDSMKAFNNQRAAKGIKYFKIELSSPRISSRGAVYNFAYAIPAQTIVNDYEAYLKARTDSNIARVIACVTTDGNIKKYNTVNVIGRWRCCVSGNVKSLDDVLADVKNNTEVEIELGSSTRMNEPWYVFRMKYKTPYKMGGKLYPWCYYISKPNGYFVFQRYILSHQDEFVYADSCEIYDPKIMGHKATSVKEPEYPYLSRTGEILSDVAMGEPKVMLGTPDNETMPQNAQSTVAAGANSVQQQTTPQPEKKYTFSIPLMKNGVPSGTFTINSATEAEAKEQMRNRFPGWTQETINAKFEKYAKPLPQNNIALQESDLRYMVGQVCEQFAQQFGAT